MKRAIFIDPIETLVRRPPEAGWDPKGWFWLAHAPEALKAVRDAGYDLYLMLEVPDADPFELREFLDSIEQDYFYHLHHRLEFTQATITCFHSTTGLCDCRLRQVGEAVEQLSYMDLDRPNCWVVSSLESDLKMARMFGFSQARITRAVPSPTVSYQTFRVFRTFAERITGNKIVGRWAPRMVSP